MLPKIFNFLKGDIRKSLYFTVSLIALSICFGSLNHVAPLVTIFYLLCYGGVNIACFLLDLLGSPNWRPKWKYYHKLTAGLGVLFCVASMIVISWWASLSSIVGALVIYAYLDKKSQEKNWGDGIEGIRAERARNALLKIDKFKKHVKNWRPHYLALGYINEKGKISSPGIFKLLHQLRKGTGLAIYGCVVKGDYTSNGYEEGRKKEAELDAFMKRNKYNVFSKVIVSQNIENGMIYLI
jgi:potassium/chloride transporter 4/5/6